MHELFIKTVTSHHQNHHFLLELDKLMLYLIIIIQLYLVIRELF